MTEKIYKTTEKHFEILKKEAKKWIKIFGLIGWDIRFIHRDLNDINVYANCNAKLDAHVAIITLNTQWSEKITNYNIKRTAFHEVCEVLFERIDYIARARYINDGEIEDERHNLITILENIIFDEPQRQGKTI